MELKIDQEAIAKAINDNATKAVASALSGWEVQKTVADAITTEVAQGAVADAIRAAVGKIDRNELVNTLASEIQKAVTRAVISILNEGLVDIVCKLRGIGNYTEDDRRKRAAIGAELLNNNH